MTSSPDLNAYPAHDRSQFTLAQEHFLDQGLDPFAGEFMMKVQRDKAVAFVHDGQPLEVTVNGVTGIESPAAGSVKRESVTRYQIQAEFRARQSEEAIEAGVIPDALPAVHGLRVVIPKVRGWRKQNPPLATVFIDTFHKPTGAFDVGKFFDEM